MLKRNNAAALQLTCCGFHTNVYSHSCVARVLSGGISGNSGVRCSDCGDAGDRFVSGGVGICKADDECVKHLAEYESIVVREIDVGSAGGNGNDCFSVGDRSVSCGVGASEADRDDIVNGGIGNEEGVACEINVDSAGGIGNNCCDGGDLYVNDDVCTSNTDSDGTEHYW